MILRFAPLLLLAGCGVTQAQDPEFAFRRCIREQFRALNYDKRPSYAAAKEFAENCSARIESLPLEKQQQLIADYTCALSLDLNHCPAVN